MLAGKQVVVAAADAAERIARLALDAACARSRPGRRRHLHHKSLAGIVPGQQSLRMGPRRVIGTDGIAVELVVPDHIIEIAVIDLIEGGADRIAGGRATFDQVYNGNFNYVIWNDQFYG